VSIALLVLRDGTRISRFKICYEST